MLQSEICQLFMSFLICKKGNKILTVIVIFEKIVKMGQLEVSTSLLENRFLAELELESRDHHRISYRFFRFKWNHTSYARLLSLIIYTILFIC